LQYFRQRETGGNCVSRRIGFANDYRVSASPEQFIQLLLLVERHILMKKKVNYSYADKYSKSEMLGESKVYITTIAMSSILPLPMLIFVEIVKFIVIARIL